MMPVTTGTQGSGPGKKKNRRAGKRKKHLVASAA